MGIFDDDYSTRERERAERQMQSEKEAAKRRGEEERQRGAEQHRQATTGFGDIPFLDDWF